MHYLTRTNKKSNDYLLVLICQYLHYLILYGKSCQIIHFDSLSFNSLYDSNHFFLFISIRFSIQTLWIWFNHKSNHKKHYLPKLITEAFKNKVSPKITKPWWLRGLMCQSNINQYSRSRVPSGRIHLEIWSFPIFKVVLFGQE